MAETKVEMPKAETAKEKADLTAIQPTVAKPAHLKRGDIKNQLMETLSGVRVDDLTTPSIPEALDNPPTPMPAALADKIPPVAETPAPVAPAAPAAPPVTSTDQKFDQVLEALKQGIRVPPPQPVPPPVEIAPEAERLARAVAERDYDTLEKYGLSLQDWADAATDDNPQGKELRELRRELMAMREETKAAQEAIAQQRRMQEDAQVAAVEQQIKGRIKATLEANPQLKLLQIANFDDKVYNKITEHGRKTLDTYGKAEFLDPAKAAQAVMAEEGPRIQALLEHARTLPEYSSYFAAPVGGATTTTVQAPQGTISHGQMSGTSLPKPITREDRLAKALELVGQLKR